MHYLDFIIAIIKIGQEEDGYITTWMTIKKTRQLLPHIGINRLGNDGLEKVRAMSYTIADIFLKLHRHITSPRAKEIF